MNIDLKRQIPDLSLRLEIKKARALCALYGEIISSDEEIRALLVDYRKAIRRSGDLMSEVGVVKACTVCALEGAGSCCFHGIEEGYDEMLLLINLLLGCEIPDARQIAGSCFFVGDHGCKLLARYYFCVQYLCPEIKRVLSEPRSEDLLVTIGDEIFAGWMLEQAIRRRLKSQRPERQLCQIPSRRSWLRPPGSIPPKGFCG